MDLLSENHVMEDRDAIWVDGGQVGLAIGKPVYMYKISKCQGSWK